WGGRSSCKRLLLVKNGVFNQRFGRIIEDIELGYRLSKVGLRVIYNARAKQYMNRPLTFADFCRRCEAQGTAHWNFSRLHAAPVVRRYCRVDGAREQWAAVRAGLAAQVQRVEQLEREAARGRAGKRGRAMVRELWTGYRSTFEAYRLKGVVDA